MIECISDLYEEFIIPYNSPNFMKSWTCIVGPPRERLNPTHMSGSLGDGWITCWCCEGVTSVADFLTWSNREKNMVPKKVLWLPKSSYQVSLLVSLYYCDFPIGWYGSGFGWTILRWFVRTVLGQFHLLRTLKDIKGLIPNLRVEVSDIFFWIHCIG